MNEVILIVSIVKILVRKPNSFLVFFFNFFLIHIDYISWFT